MKKMLLLLFLVAFSFTSFCQQGKDTIDYSKELKHVQVQPAFPGGTSTLELYLNRNGLKRGVDSNDNKTAIVSFLVDNQGTVSEVTVTNKNKIDAKLAKKAEKVIKNSPRWQPAIQNGRNAIYRKVILISL
jgi:protein TonB